jgi:hypothetical protein
MLWPSRHTEVSVLRGAEQQFEVAGAFLRRFTFIALALASASCATARARTRPEEIVRRGTLIAKGWSVSSLARGPALVHVYSEAAGGLVYIAAASGEAGGGCSRSPGGTLAEAALEPERRMTVAIREGEVLCLYTQAPRTVEVLWHSHRVSPLAPEYRLRSAALATAKP